MIESLVALALVSSALMGLLWVQWKALADSAASVRRSQAIQLIEDLSDRVRSNPQARTRLDDYRVDWAQSVEPLVDCRVEGCDAAHLARWDLSRWKSAIARQLPRGDATVYPLPGQAGVPTTMLGVMVGWRSGDQAAEPEVDADQPAQCPSGWVCHFGHVQP